MSAQKIRTRTFQAVPGRFNLQKALKKLYVFRWNVNQSKKEIQAGDDVYLWLAGAKGGLVARGTVLTPPQDLRNAAEEVPYELEPDEKAPRLRVVLQVEQVLDAPVSRASLKEHPILKSLSIIEQAQGTNFPVTDEQVEALE